MSVFAFRMPARAVREKASKSSINWPRRLEGVAMDLKQRCASRSNALGFFRLNNSINPSIWRNGARNSCDTE